MSEWPKHESSEKQPSGAWPVAITVDKHAWDELRAENERLRAQLKAEHETAVAAIAGSEKEIERLRSQIDTCQGNAHYRAWQESQAENERLRAALEHMLTIGHVDASWYQAIARHALARDTEC